jgi:hypothetical protein
LHQKQPLFASTVQKVVDNVHCTLYNDCINRHIKKQTDQQGDRNMIQTNNPLGIDFGDILNKLSKELNYSFTKDDIIVLVDYPDWAIDLQVCNNAFWLKTAISNYHIRHRTMNMLKKIEHISNVTNIKQDEIKKIQPTDLHNLYMYIRNKELFTSFEFSDVQDCVAEVYRVLKLTSVEIKSIKLNIPKSKASTFENNIPVGVQYNLKISNRDDGQILNVKIKNITVEQFQTLLVAIA